ncbi:MAG: von Willebrand factor, type [Acidobacteriales bacterium]|nr:von Willebrand factor, type [Terriglobales bacterium]
MLSFGNVRALGLLCYHRLKPEEITLFRGAKRFLFPRLPLTLCFGLWLLLISFAVAQTADDVHIQPRKKPDPPGTPHVVEDPSLKTHTKPIKVDVDLVLVNATVTDPMNRLVTGLEKENFSLLEANALQDIKYFSSEDAPISLGVVFDLSGSMNNKIEKSRDAIVEFFKTANPQDEFFLITFADKPELLADFTQSIEEIQGKLVYAIPKGRTSLLDAIYLGISKMKQAKHNKKALLIISDGGDNRSRYTDSEIKSLVKEADVQIYAIGIFDDIRGTPEEIRGPFLLTEITQTTGGRTFPVSDVNELGDVATKIGVELRNQYVLGYRPKNTARDGKWRKLKVKLHAPKGLPPLNVHAKTGYYAPQQ